MQIIYLAFVMWMHPQRMTKMHYNELANCDLVELNNWKNVSL